MPHWWWFCIGGDSGSVTTATALSPNMDLVCNLAHHTTATAAVTSDWSQAGTSHLVTAAVAVLWCAKLWTRSMFGVAY